MTDNSGKMTTAEVAALLGVSTKTVERLGYTGELRRVSGDRPRRPGTAGAPTRVYFERADVLAYQRQAEVSAVQDADR